MGLSPVKRESISEQVYEQIKQMIIDREWELGEKLPSETELGNILGVSRVTVRQALQKLAVLGLVETRLGEGTFVCEANMAARMKASLVPDIYLTPHSTEEVLDGGAGGPEGHGGGHRRAEAPAGPAAGCGESHAQELCRRRQCVPYDHCQEHGQLADYRHL